MASCVLPVDERENLNPDMQRCAHTSKQEMPHKKRYILCCDGTTNNANDATLRPTNVGQISTVLAHKCCSGMPQVVYYHRGVGAGSMVVEKAIAGYSGAGIEHDIKDSYRFICDNYNPGDEIVVLGFSRGAFTARATAGIACSIGLLNSFGLANFGHVFEDYKSFGEWSPTTRFNKAKHLPWLKFSNFTYTEVLDQELRLLLGPEEPDYLEKIYGYPKNSRSAFGDEKLSNYGWKKILFDALIKCLDKQEKLLGKHETYAQRLEKISDFYATILSAMQMIHCQGGEASGPTGFTWKPRKVTIKAIGVWDTVGSLWTPKGTSIGGWISPGRHSDEIRFTDLHVHERVDYAFHALALDEWRSAFPPTPWYKDIRNQRTKLRQVWFPGTHSDVGGGFEDQQIATISLAWMADQLSGIGVEFVPSEMVRLFRDANLPTERGSRAWGLGQIHPPDAFTGFANKIRDGFWHPIKTLRGESHHFAGRTPGYHKHDDGSPLKNTNELVHPSVRVRYLYGGKDLDDEADYVCEALTMRYDLKRQEAPRPPELKEPRMTYASTFETLCGNVLAVRGGMTIPDPPNARKLAKQLPFEDHETIYLPNQERKEKWTWETLRQPENQNKDPTQWTWTDQPDDARIAQGPDGEWRRDGKLSNPPIDQWCWVLKEKLQKQQKKVKKDTLLLHEERIGMWERLLLKMVENINREKKSAVVAQSWDWMDPVKGAMKLANQAYELPGKLLNNAAVMVMGSHRRPDLFEPYCQYGYHDFIAWQHGDLREFGALRN